MRPPLPRLGARIAAVVAVMALFATLTGTASAKVTWRGIGPVELGMSASQVRAELGSPSEVEEAHAPGSQRYHYPRRKLEVALYSGKVVAVHTRSRAHRTSSGIGVGTSERTMRRRLRGETCGEAQGRRVCSVARRNTVMDFNCRRGRVVRIGVSRLY